MTFTDKCIMGVDMTFIDATELVHSAVTAQCGLWEEDGALLETFEWKAKQPRWTC